MPQVSTLLEDSKAVLGDLFPLSYGNEWELPCIMCNVRGLDSYSTVNLFVGPLAVPRRYQTCVGRSKKIYELNKLVIELYEDAWYKYSKLPQSLGSITEEKMLLEIHLAVYYRNYTPI